MSSPKVDRNRQLRERRQRHRVSVRRLAHEFGVSPVRVQQILEEGGGDPIRLERVEDLARATRDDLRWEHQRLADRIATDLRRLLTIDDEIEIRRTDEILGLPH